MKKIVVLLSGGMDSSTCCLYFKEKGYNIFPLFIDYGQLSKEGEWKACQKVSESLKLHKPKHLKIPKIGSLYSCLLTKKGKIPKSSFQSFRREFFPQRNLLLATLASIYTTEMDSKFVGLGVVSGGEASYSDANEVFLGRLNQILNLSTKVKVIAPFVSKSDRDILRYGLNRNFNYSLTYSCNIRTNMHCGRCASCVRRHQAFAEIGKIDPTKYETEPE